MGLRKKLTSNNRQALCMKYFSKISPTRKFFSPIQLQFFFQKENALKIILHCKVLCRQLIWEIIRPFKIPTTSVGVFSTKMKIRFFFFPHIPCLSFLLIYNHLKFRAMPKLVRNTKPLSFDSERVDEHKCNKRKNKEKNCLVSPQSKTSILPNQTTMYKIKQDGTKTKP